MERLIEWESGERSWEPIKNIYTGDKYMLAEYARDHDLLDKWESSKMKIRAALQDAPQDGQASQAKVVQNCSSV